MRELPLPPPSTSPALFVGMLHLRPLPGSPGAHPIAAVREALYRDAEALVEGGARAMIVENFGDAPFFPASVPPITVAAMATLAGELVARFDLPLGVNVLRNDGVAALSVAVAADASFVRVNVLTGARLTDQGLVSGVAHEVARERARLGAAHVRVVGDLAVKHSAPLAEVPLVEEGRDMLERGGADALVLSGSRTGAPIDEDELAELAAALDPAPILVGSGVSLESAPRLARRASGLIVGTALKHEGRIDGPVDAARVRAMAEAIAAA